MNESLLDVLIKSKNDLSLTKLKAYIDMASKSKKSQNLTGKIVQAMTDIVSFLSASAKRNSESIEILLDTFYYISRNNKAPKAWTELTQSILNLILRLLSVIQTADKFPKLFYKLLCIISTVCLHNPEIWRHISHPILHEFLNKKLDCFHLEKSLKEFNKMSRYGGVYDMPNLTPENLKFMQGFSKLLRHVGDFCLQMMFLDLIFLYVGGDTHLMREFLIYENEGLNETLQKLDFENFERDSRLFLNTLNNSLGDEIKILSINCDIIYFGNKLLSSPVGSDGIWMDVNRETKRISISCLNFLADSQSNSVTLQVPLNEVNEMKVEFRETSGENCYCIRIVVRKLAELYRFANGGVIICTASGLKNTPNKIKDFVRLAEELSDNIQQQKKENGSGALPKIRFSTTSPILISTVNLANQMSEMCVDKNQKMRKYTADMNKKCNANLQTSSLTQKQSLNSSLSSSQRDQTNYSFGDLNYNGKSENGVTQSNDEKCENPTLSKDSKEERLRNYSRKIYEEWMSSCEESSQEFVAQQRHVTKLCEPIPIWGGVQKTNKRTRQTDWLVRNKKMTICRQSKKEITSLLDPNGYSFKRWKMESTSERSKFWLNKLKDNNMNKKNNLNSSRDIFEFSDADASDDSAVFRKEKKSRNERVLCRKGDRRISIRVPKKIKPGNETAVYDIDLGSVCSDKCEDVWSTRCGSKEDEKLVECDDEFSRDEMVKLNSDVDGILEQISASIEEYLQYTRKRNMEEMSSFLRKTKEMLNNISDEQEENKERTKRFEKCMEFFMEGCSQSVSNGRLRNGLEGLKEMIGEVKVRYEKAAKNVVKFIDRLKTSIEKRADELFEKERRMLKIMYMERNI